MAPDAEDRDGMRLGFSFFETTLTKNIDEPVIHLVRWMRRPDEKVYSNDSESGD